MAAMVASVPELTIRTFSTEGTMPDNQLRHLNLLTGRGTERERMLNSVAHGFFDRLKCVAQDHRPPRVNQFNVLPAIFIIHVGSFGRFYKQGRSAYGPEGPHGGVDPAWNQGFSFLEKFFAGCHA
jgi:hypothetical protein